MRGAVMDAILRPSHEGPHLALVSRPAPEKSERKVRMGQWSQWQKVGIEFKSWSRHIKEKTAPIALSVHSSGSSGRDHSGAELMYRTGTREPYRHWVVGAYSVTLHLYRRAIAGEIARGLSMHKRSICPMHLFLSYWVLALRRRTIAISWVARPPMGTVKMKARP